jgi:type I restriction enzyme S subunit
LIKVRFGAEVLPEWALVWFLSPGGRHQIEQVASSTSGLHTLSTGKVSRLPMPLPAIEEQRRILAEVDRQLSLVRGLEGQLHSNLLRVDRLRESVLSAALSGNT